MIRKHSRQPQRFYCKRSHRWHKPAQTQELVLRDGTRKLWWSCTCCADNDSHTLGGHYEMQWHMKRLPSLPLQTVYGIPVIGELTATTSIPALIVAARMAEDRYALAEEHVYA